MKTLKKIVEERLVDTIRIDPAVDERYSNTPIFQRKIDRLYELLKDTPLDPNLKKQRPISASSKSLRQVSSTNS